MKLEDIKESIDSYFENISEQDLYDLLTEKYHMPVIYDLSEAVPQLSEKEDKLLCVDTYMEYEHRPVYNMQGWERVKSTVPSNRHISDDVTSMSYDLIIAA